MRKKNTGIYSGPQSDSHRHRESGCNCHVDKEPPRTATVHLFRSDEEWDSGLAGNSLPNTIYVITNRIHVWYIYPHLPWKLLYFEWSPPWHVGWWLSGGGCQGELEVVFSQVVTRTMKTPHTLVFWTFACSCCVLPALQYSNHLTAFFAPSASPCGRSRHGESLETSQD